MKTEVESASRSLPEDLARKDGEEGNAVHAPDLPVPGRKPVPREERDRPNDAALRKAVLSKDPFCVFPGCGRLAEHCHHLQPREEGGRTSPDQEVGLCRPHHGARHDGEFLLSGAPGDLRFSDPRGFPILRSPVAPDPILEIDPPAPSPGEEPIPEGGALPDPEVPAGPAAPDAWAALAPALLPAAIDAAFWRAHRAGFRWSDRRLVYDPERAIETSPHDPSPAGESKETPSVPSAAERTRSDRAEGADAVLPAFAGFLGQGRAVRNLSDSLRVARLDGGLPPHILLCGPPGLGKSTLAGLVAAELGSKVHRVQGPVIEGIASLVRILPELRSGDVFFIDEIHRIPAEAAELLYQALDEGAIDIEVARGAASPVVRLRLEPFVLIGATTDESLLPKPLHSRFGLHERLDFYGQEDLQALAVSRGKASGVEVLPEAAGLLARTARGTPRRLLALVSRARGLARLEGKAVTLEVARRALASEGIDRHGLDETDRAILRALVESGRPVGLRSLADLLGESRRNIAEVYEPYLYRERWIRRTERGRVASEKARRLFSPGEVRGTGGIDETRRAAGAAVPRSRPASDPAEVAAEIEELVDFFRRRAGEAGGRN